MNLNLTPPHVPEKKGLGRQTANKVILLGFPFFPFEIRKPNNIYVNNMVLYAIKYNLAKYFRRLNISKTLSRVGLIKLHSRYLRFSWEYIFESKNSFSMIHTGQANTKLLKNRWNKLGALSWVPCIIISLQVSVIFMDHIVEIILHF